MSGARTPLLGQGPRRASNSAIMAPPPGPGEVRRTALPETFDGIRYEIGRMIKYVEAARQDPVMLANTDAICRQYYQGLEHSAKMNGRTLAGADPRDICVNAIDAWCREHYVYVNDPPNIEVIQTPRRMVQMTKIPPAVLGHLIEPFYEAMLAVADEASVRAYQPPPVCIGDCDEGGTLFLSHCAACRHASFDQLLFDFGGHDESIHHVWSGVVIDGKHIASDLTEPGYKLGDFSRFPHYEHVQITFDGRPTDLRGLGTQLGIAATSQSEAPPRKVISDAKIRRMAEKIADYRKDALMVDTARLVGVHYGKMVEHFSALENRPVSAHNNKTLFLEGIDLWSRKTFSVAGRGAPTTENPREVIAHVMRPWYEAMDLDDPSRYKLGRRPEKPRYVGSPEDLTCAMMGLAACLDITPMNLAFGMDGEQPREAWARVFADGNWYDSYVQGPEMVLGDRPDYSKVEEIEVPL